LIEGPPRDLTNLEDEISWLRGEVRAVCEKIDKIKWLFEE
jgi:hypothetical protein